jgi:hypothetical protein
MMRELLDEMAAAFDAKAYYPTLITAVTLPDMCSALGSKDGQADFDKYVEWFDKYAAKYFNKHVDGRTAYFIRCAVVHQGRLVHGAFKKGFEIMFVTENNTQISVHLTGLVKDGKDFLVLELHHFCHSIYQAVMEWLSVAEETENYKRNYKKFFQKDKQPWPWDDKAVSIIASTE